MPIVFIHGVPDTYRVWSAVRAELTRTDQHALSLPGFGTPRPADFHCTKEEYVEFIIRELEALPAPVDLVGHDWGCSLVLRVVAQRPDLVRAWAAGAGPASLREYEWHPLAKIWQTPGEGEKWMADPDIASRVARLAQQGVPLAHARDAVGRMDDTMKDSILKLYRSATHIAEEWGSELASIRTPGLVLWGKDDDACPVRFAELLAAATHAREVVTFDCGHWFPEARPREVARALDRHFNR